MDISSQWFVTSIKLIVYSELSICKREGEWYVARKYVQGVHYPVQMTAAIGSSQLYPLN